MLSDTRKDTKKAWPFRRFTHEALLAYRTLGYKRQISTAWEDIADLPIFDNIHILHDGKQWKKSNSVFKGVRRLKYLYHILDFDFLTYQKRNARVAPLRILTPEQLNTKFDIQTRQPLIQWQQIIDSIPDEWKQILQTGNEEHQNGEFFATSGEIPGTINNVFKWNGIDLCMYEQSGDDISILSETEFGGSPGQPYRDGNGNLLLNDDHNGNLVPDFSELRRVRVTTLKDNTVKVASFMLPDYNRWSPNDHGILIRWYSNEVSNNHSSVTKKWREAQVPRPPNISAIAHSAFGDPGFDFTQLTGVISNLIVAEKVREMMQKILHSALYIGDVARSYQIRVKGISQANAMNWQRLGNTLVSEFCPYTAHEFAPTYHKRGPNKPVAEVVANYDYIFWGSPIASAVWSVIRTTLQAMEMDLPIQHWLDILKFLQNQHGKEYNLRFYNQSAIILTGLWVLYKGFFDMTNLHKIARDNGEPIRDETIDRWPEHIQKEAHRQLTTIAFGLPVVNEEAIKRKTIIIDGKRIRCLSERQQALRPKVSITTDIDGELAELYAQTWLKTKLVVVQDGKLFSQPFLTHDYPP